MHTNDGRDNLQRYDAWLNSSLLAGTLVTLVLAYAFVMLPVERQVAQRQSETLACQQLVEQASAQTRTNRRLKEKLAKTQTDADRLEQRIPSAPRESDFLAQVCQLADQVGMQVVDYQSGATVPLETHREMEVKLNARGAYEPLCQFLSQVDEIPRLCRLTHLEIVPEPTGTNLTVVLTFRIYFSAPNETTVAKQNAA